MQAEYTLCVSLVVSLEYEASALTPICSWLHVSLAKSVPFTKMSHWTN